ncbi:hypothetical protein [Methanogenium cariaci]|uniref:hypothetical protein n=1 Tax=Methanogenium cariaci TaxID=2197 RepID=UPI0012F6503B|nr:hypothetical protein [Methanogenium cariaci]
MIGVFFFSQPVAEELPAVDILLSNNGSTILFQHNGGDSLAEDEFRIYVGGNAVAATELSFIDGGNWPWSVGETIQYTATGPITPPLDENVLIAHREEKGILLRPTFVDITGTSTDLADVASAPLPTLSPGGGGQAAQLRKMRGGLLLHQFLQIQRLSSLFHRLTGKISWEEDISISRLPLRIQR